MSSRYICEILDDMRKCYETRNFSYLMSLIEECQCAAGRMENALSSNHELRTLPTQRDTLKDEIRELRWEKNELEEEIRKLKVERRQANRDVT